MTTVKFESLHKLFTLPKKGSIEAAGWDMIACIDENIVLRPGERVAISLGCKSQIPVGYAVDVKPRSGLALKNGITVLNTPGLIDSDYRGEWKVIVVNTAVDRLGGEFGSLIRSNDFTITPGMKICQVELRKIELMEPELVDSVDDTARGTGGFGSTDKV